MWEPNPCLDILYLNSWKDSHAHNVTQFVILSSLLFLTLLISEDNWKIVFLLASEKRIIFQNQHILCVGSVSFAFLPLVVSV